MRHDHLVADGKLGSGAMQCLECVLEEVTMLTVVRAPCTVLKLRASDPLVRLAVGLWLDAPSLPPKRGLG
jgi:hypothetical protein